MEFSRDTERGVPNAEFWSFTKLNKKKFTYTWTINDFSLRPESVGEAMKSARFPSCFSNLTTWYLRLYPRGKSEDSKDFILCELSLNTIHQSLMRALATYKLSISHANGKKQETKGQKMFKDGDNLILCMSIQRNDFLCSNNDQLRSDKLKVFCEITVSEDSLSICWHSHMVKIKDQEHRLCEDLRKLFEDKNFTDVTFSVSGGEFHAHKSILAARSPVFAAMLQSIWEEGKQNIIELKEINITVFKEMMRFIYTGKVTDLGEIAEKLLEAAERFQLESLKEVCAEELCTTLDTENAVDYLILSDRHRLDELKSQAIALINNNASEGKCSPGWQNLCKSHPHFLLEAWMSLLSLKTLEEETDEAELSEESELPDAESNDETLT